MLIQFFSKPKINHLIFLFLHIYPLYSRSRKPDRCTPAEPVLSTSDQTSGFQIAINPALAPPCHTKHLTRSREDIFAPSPLLCTLSARIRTSLASSSPFLMHSMADLVQDHRRWHTQTERKIQTRFSDWDQGDISIFNLFLPHHTDSGHYAASTPCFLIKPPALVTAPLDLTLSRASLSQCASMHQVCRTMLCQSPHGVFYLQTAITTSTTSIQSKGCCASNVKSYAGGKNILPWERLQLGLLQLSFSFGATCFLSGLVQYSSWKTPWPFSSSWKISNKQTPTF